MAARKKVVPLGNVINRLKAAKERAIIDKFAVYQTDGSTISLPKKAVFF